MIKNKFEVIRTVAKRLDAAFEKIETFEARKCMLEMSPDLRELLTKEELPEDRLLRLRLHTATHLAELCPSEHTGIPPGFTWRQYYDAIIWNSFGGLVTCMLPIAPKHFNSLLIRLAQSVFTFEEAIASPMLFHFNYEMNVPQGNVDGREQERVERLKNMDVRILDLLTSCEALEL